ncbi:unnamed protein product [Trichogramma brassicae]|uniref:DDE-1 domain-containing protein n=1 Tax=Trichogramma brassicae TaxID=86971 RepID=A0A6H5IPM0_9HYME|nr:unnamed protein product [Trichogramma brassicae]
MSRARAARASSKSTRIQKKSTWISRKSVVIAFFSAHDRSTWNPCMTHVESLYDPRGIPVRSTDITFIHKFFIWKRSPLRLESRGMIRCRIFPRCRWAFSMCLNFLRERASADHEAARKFPDQVRLLIAENGYVAAQIFNCDETGLFWKRMPNRTYLMREEKSAPEDFERIYGWCFAHPHTQAFTHTHTHTHRRATFTVSRRDPRDGVTARVVGPEIDSVKAYPRDAPRLFHWLTSHGGRRPLDATGSPRIGWSSGVIVVAAQRPGGDHNRTRSALT